MEIFRKESQVAYFNVSKNSAKRGGGPQLQANGEMYEFRC